jgi:WD40 repeat protein
MPDPKQPPPLPADPKNPPPPATLVPPPAAHPGWVNHLCYTPDGKYIVSVGGAPRNKGYLAVWNAADGKILHGVELPLGPINNVAVSQDGANLLLACGPRARLVPQADAVLFRMPVK